MFHLNSLGYYNACEIFQIISFPEKKSPTHDIRAGRTRGLQSPHVSADVMGAFLPSFSFPNMKCLV